MCTNYEISTHALTCLCSSSMFLILPSYCFSWWRACIALFIASFVYCRNLAFLERWSSPSFFEDTSPSSDLSAVQPRRGIPSSFHCSGLASEEIYWNIETLKHSSQSEMWKYNSWGKRPQEKQPALRWQQNPKTTRIRWSKKGILLEANTANTIIMSLIMIWILAWASRCW